MTDQMHPAERARRYSRACGLRHTLLYPPADAPPLPEPEPDGGWWHVAAVGLGCVGLLIGWASTCWPDLVDGWHQVLAAVTK